MPPVFHGQAENRRCRRPGRQVPSQVRDVLELSGEPPIRTPSGLVVAIGSVTAAICISLALAAPGSAWAKDKKARQSEDAAAADFGDPAVGRKHHQQILDAYGSYDNDGLAAYVQKVGEELVAHAGGHEYDWHFTVLDMESVNAFATPGGYVYITRKLLTLLNSEAQLAAVLGHEIGHVVNRHAAQQHTAVNVIANVSDKLAKYDEPGSFNLGNLFGAGLVRGYGREMELEADEAGANMISAIGHDPRAMLEVVELLKAVEEYAESGSEKATPNRYHAMLATHPDQDRRRRELVEAASSEYGITRDAGRDEYLGHVDGTAWVGSRSQGVVRGSRFLHQELDFALTFPDDWQILNLPDKLVGLSPGEAGMMQVSVADRSSRKHRKIPVDRFLQKVLGMSKWQSARTTEINGLEAFIATVPQVRTPDGIRTGRVAVIFHDTNAFVFFGTTKDADRQRRYDRTFDRIIGSMRRLDAAELQLSEPQAVRVVELGPGASLSDFTPIAGVDDPEALLRLLNGLHRDGQPQPGDRIKIIQ